MDRWRKAFDFIQTWGEWVLIALMVGAAVLLIINIPDSAARLAEGGGVGPVQEIFGVVGAAFAYATLWVTESAVLAYAKATGNTQLRKWALFAIFLTHTFSLTLAWTLQGFGLSLLDNFLIVGGSAWLWLRARLQWDYYDDPTPKVRTRWTWALAWERLLSLFKYFIALSLMLNGFLTALFAQADPGVSALGFIYESATTLHILGVIIFFSGLWLLVGKIRRSSKQTGHGLMAVFCCYWFATVLQYVAYAGDPAAWLVNLIMAIIMGLLYLRWRFKTAYVDPNHFIRDVEELTSERNRLAARERNLPGD